MYSLCHSKRHVYRVLNHLKCSFLKISLLENSQFRLKLRVKGKVTTIASVRFPEVGGVAVCLFLFFSHRVAG